MVDSVDVEDIFAFASELSASEGDDWQWVSCGESDCVVCAGLREEFPHREVST